MYKTFPTFALNLMKYRMNQHTCLLCMGTNFERRTHLEAAREALKSMFTDIRFGPEMETEAIGDVFLSPFSNQVAVFTTALAAEEVRSLLKGIEKENGRMKEDKAKGIVKLDIDLLKYDETVLKPEDMERDFVREGIRKIALSF